MKDIKKISKRYSQALMAAIIDSNADTLELAEKVLATLNGMTEAFKSQAGSLEIFSNPSITSDQKSNFLINFAKDAFAADELFINFLKVLCENSRVLALSEISKDFAVLVANLKQALIVEVSSASNLTENEKEDLLSQLKSGMKSQPTVNWSVDSSLLAGLVVRVGDRVFDGSLKSSLSRAKELLLA